MFAKTGTCVVAAVRTWYMACSIDSSILLRTQTAVPDALGSGGASIRPSHLPYPSISPG